MVMMGVSFVVSSVVSGLLMPCAAGAAQSGANAPSINIKATTYTPGSIDVVNGKGFPGATRVEVSLGPVLVGVETTDRHGDFTLSFTVPTRTAIGTYRLVAFAHGLKAVYYLGVQPFHAWASPASYYVRDGRPISFSGHGFMPGEAVIVFYNRDTTVFATADRNGDFSTPGVPFQAELARPGQQKSIHVIGLLSLAKVELGVTVAP